MRKKESIRSVDIKPEQKTADAFTGFHPAVNLLYFTAMIGFAMFFTHPVCLGISLLLSLSYTFYLSGRKALRFTLRYMLPVLIIAALINPAFNHRGATILAYFPNGNPLTLESILYGIAASVMLVTVISWFSCFNIIMTSNKIVFLFGKAVPSLSLVFSMALRFVPRFTAQIKVISNAQKCVGRDVSSGNLLAKAKHGIRILSIMVTWALENAIETADSMKCRGYGLPGRTAFSIFRFCKRDCYAISYIIVCSAIVLAGAALGVYNYAYFPIVSGAWSGGIVLVFAAYFMLGAFPLIVNIKEDLIWKDIIQRQIT